MRSRAMPLHSDTSRHSPHRMHTARRTNLNSRPGGSQSEWTTLPQALSRLGHAGEALAGKVKVNVTPLRR
jgi:cytochrome c-type biogenesis protein CcmH/NrfG